MLNTIFTFLLLATTTAIPFYFQYWVKSANREVDQIQAMSARCTGGILVHLFLFSFISSPSSEHSLHTNGMIGFGACIFSIFLLFHFRSKTIHEIRKVTVDPRARFIHSVRNFLALAASYGIYFTVAHLLSPLTGTLPSIVIGITALFYLSPFIVRIWFSSTPMYPSELKDEIVQIFADAGVNIRRVYLMDTDKVKLSNAMVCGPKYGFGPFSRSLFITQNLFEVLEHDELRAVICHEASHFKLHHLIKRGAASFSAFLLGIVVVGFPVSLLSTLLFTKGAATSSMVLMVVLNIFFQFSFLFRVIRKQEFEADIEAVNLGADPAKLISALEKITRFNGGTEKKQDSLTRVFLGSGHPSVSERKEAILHGAVPESASIFPQKKWVLSYVGGVAALFAITLTWAPNAHRGAERVVASEPASEPDSTR